MSRTRTTGAAVLRWQPDDALPAAVATAALGAGLVLAAAGTGTADLRLVLGGGALVCMGLTVLVAIGALDGLLVVALALPLPALVATDDLRVAAAAPVTAAVIAGWLALPRSAPLRVPRRVLQATLLVLAAFVIATGFAASRFASARELINMTVLLGFFLLAIDRARDARAAERTLLAATAVAAACGALAVLEMVGVLPGAFPRWGTPFNRAALGFGQPNGLGLFLAVMLPLGLHAVRRTAGVAKTGALLGLGCMVAGLLATFSRGSWLAVLAGAGALAFVGERRLLLRVLAGAALAAVILDVASGGMLRDTAERTLTDWVIEQRAALMLAGVLMFLAHPFVGVGPGGFAVELSRFGAQIPELWDYLPTPHNAYVQMAAETGLLGLAAWLTFFTVCLAALVRAARAVPVADTAERSLRACLLWSFATACAAGLVVWPFAHGTGQAVLLLLAIGVARPLARRA